MLEVGEGAAFEWNIAHRPQTYARVGLAIGALKYAIGECRHIGEGIAQHFYGFTVVEEGALLRLHNAAVVFLGAGIVAAGGAHGADGVFDEGIIAELHHAGSVGSEGVGGIEHSGGVCHCGVAPYLYALPALSGAGGGDSGTIYH